MKVSSTEFRMLRRSVAVIIACAAVLAVAGCGIKGPLKLPPGKPAPTGLPPGAAPTTTLPKPADTPAPVEPTPEENKDKQQ
jgi:predicted small lipoprotein YifL